MSTHEPHLSRDIFAMRYLEAVQAGDMEAVAACWDETSRDAELERVLVEVDACLFEEELIARRELRPKQVGEVTSTVRDSASPTFARARWRSAVVLFGALAAIWLFVYLAWRAMPPEELQGIQQTAQVKVGQHLSGALGDSELHQLPGGGQIVSFSWPLETKTPVTASSKIPDLFN